MRSYQVEKCITKDAQSEFTDLQVLRSAAGWYVGTIHNDPHDFQEPGSRDTDYYPTELAAKAALALMEYAHEQNNDPKIWTWAWSAFVEVCGLDPRKVGYRTNP